MTPRVEPWDYLIITAAHDDQAAAYETQLQWREELGLLAGVRHVLVISDRLGKRIGSGGSTLQCLMEVLRREHAHTSSCPTGEEAWRRSLAGLRILILHAGGDAKRLPSYGPCGKIFIPVPGESDGAAPLTLFDRQAPTYLALPPGPEGAGQVVITSGDVLLNFDPGEVRFDGPGIIGLGCPASPEEASRHGVYCLDEGASVRLFLQKPSLRTQAAAKAWDRFDQAVLDIGVMQFNARVAANLLRAFGVSRREDGAYSWSEEMGEAIENMGLDFYREICCALGSESSPEHHLQMARQSGSQWSESLLLKVFEAIHDIPFQVRVLPQCGFFHFGTTHQIIHSGLEVLRRDQGTSRLRTCLQINNTLEEAGHVSGTHAWVEGCRIASELKLEGHNIVVGLDIPMPLTLTTKTCLSLLEGWSREAGKVYFVLCFGVMDLFKDRAEEGALFCDRPIYHWLDAVQLPQEEVWDNPLPSHERTVWNARLFPGVKEAKQYRDYLWMFVPEEASSAQKRAYRQVDRYSLAEIARLADPKAFHDRRALIRSEETIESLRKMFRLDSSFSARDLGACLSRALPSQRTLWVKRILDEAHWHGSGSAPQVAQASFALSRILHTLGSALEDLSSEPSEGMDGLLPGLGKSLQRARHTWLSELGLGLTKGTRIKDWAQRAKTLAFDLIGQRILFSGQVRPPPPTNALRSDEIVWGRAPARLDMGGGWTDTPPYSLEHGGCVLNAAVNLNGQPPIHVYGRVIPEYKIRLASIDLGTRTEISSLEDLENFRSATSEFALAKAALSLSGFSMEAVEGKGTSTLEKMLERFGGGIELTTLAAIPKGSGLGTSSIVGAVILAVLMRILGRTLTRKQLFHGVLRLEQALTTGGGWQDQIGGVVDGVKVATTQPGLVPDARIHYVPPDVLNPPANQGVTRLYYTGITRLAKDILHQVVGRVLDRNRGAMETLRRIHALPPFVAEAMARKDLPGFGALLDVAWRLNKELDPNSSNPEVEALMDRIRPHVYGAKLLGAGGGGFLLMACKSPKEAERVTEMLCRDPPNERARFFDFEVSPEGLVVTVS
jgi:galactokinase/mevalonate kinase-like predicted kinase